jgi:hypothetical protein
MNSEFAGLWAVFGWIIGLGTAFAVFGLAWARFTHRSRELKYGARRQMPPRRPSASDPDYYKRMNKNHFDRAAEAGEDCP